MRRGLKPTRLDEARTPISQLVREDWVWRGEQFVDGLYASRLGNGSVAWRQALMRHLPDATTIIESDDAAIILFDKPQTMNCDVLGRVVPLRRQHGALSSFPFKAPLSERITRAIDGSLLIILRGTIQRTNLGDFRQADISDWFDLSSVTIEKGSAPPRRPGVPEVKSLKTKGTRLFEVSYVDAGFNDIRTALDRLPDRDPSANWVVPIAKWFVGLASIIAPAAVAASGSVSLSSLALTAFALVAAVAGLSLARLIPRRKSEAKVRTQHSARQPARESRSAQVSQGSNSRVGSISAVLISLALVAIAVGSSVSDTTSIAGPLFVAAAVVLFLIWQGRRSGAAKAHQSAATPTSGYDNQAAQPYRGKGTFRRLFEKLLQKTPLSDLALGKFDRRVAELKRLFEGGRIEEALKKSLALGDDQPPSLDVKADLPISGPGIRERLDIQARRGEATHFLAALPEGAREELEALYRQHVDICIERGDYEHAAFILAELLDDGEAAVKVFADAEQFAVAARLAQGRRLSPSLFIPLWYRAGEQERALRLAERHDAYELLLQTTHESDGAFRDAIRRAWSERSANLGSYTTALAISEPLANEGDAIETKRQDWMARGLAAMPRDADLVARAVKALSQEPDAPNDPAMSAVEDLLLTDDVDAARERKRLAELLLMPGFEPHVVSAFRRQRLPVIADQLTRFLLVDHAKFGLLQSHQLLSSLADAGGQTTLAADIRRLPKVSNLSASNPTRHLIIGAKSGANGVVSAAPMRGGRLLMAQEDGRLQLLDARHQKVWSDQLWNPCDIIPIKPGRFAIIIRDEPNERKLSIIDTETLRHADIGPLNLQNWAATAESFGWLVYVDRQVLNLRLDQFLLPLSGKPLETLEHHWGTPITIDGHMRALRFEDDSGDALWLFERADHVLERWRVSRRDLDVSYQTLSFAQSVDVATVTTDFSIFEFVGTNDRRERCPVSFTAADHAAKMDRPMARIHVQTGNRRADRYDCLPLATSGESKSSVALVNSHHQVALKVSFDGAQTLSMRHSFAGDAIVLWDEAGRMLKLTTENAELEYSNVVSNAEHT